MRSSLILIFLALVTTAGATSARAADPAPPLTFAGQQGPGTGKHIVFLAGDHEYRSEEFMPALARLLAYHHGFKCTVLFTLDKQNESIIPGSNNMPHTEVIDDADLLVFGLRFQNFNAQQMQPIVDYLQRGGAIIGTRTSTHAFNIPQNSPFTSLSYQSKVDGADGGFGRQVLGETWAGHYGQNHVMSTKLEIVPEQKEHPILSGIESIWVESGGYWTAPLEDATVLAMTQPLQTMKPDAPAATDKAPCPGAWVRSGYQINLGDAVKSDTDKAPAKSSGRVFTTTAGASEDLKNDGFRRLMVNACFWAVGLEDQIKPDLKTDFVGPYQPSTFAFDGYLVEVKPQEMQGWESPIPPSNKQRVQPKRK